MELSGTHDKIQTFKIYMYLYFWLWPSYGASQCDNEPETDTRQIPGVALSVCSPFNHLYTRPAVARRPLVIINLCSPSCAQAQDRCTRRWRSSLCSEDGSIVNSMLCHSDRAGFGQCHPTLGLVVVLLILE